MQPCACCQATSRSLARESLESVLQCGHDLCERRTSKYLRESGLCESYVAFLPSMSSAFGQPLFAARFSGQSAAELFSISRARRKRRAVLSGGEDDIRRLATALLGSNCPTRYVRGRCKHSLDGSACRLFSFMSSPSDEMRQRACVISGCHLD
jgi:hypothetical protein